MIYDEINELSRQVERKRHLEKILPNIQDKERELTGRVRVLKETLCREELDVERLEGNGLAAFFLALVGTKEERLAKEKLEAREARIRCETAEKELCAVIAERESCEAEINSLRFSEARLERAQEKLQNEIKSRVESPMSNEVASDEKIKLVHHMGKLEQKGKEIEESIMAGERAAACASAVLEKLDSAVRLSTWDIIGGGLLTDMAKYSKLDEAKERIEELQIALGRFKTELADVDIYCDATASIDGFSRFADYWFDGLFSNLAVHDRIREAQDRVRATARSIDLALERLRELKQENQREMTVAIKRMSSLKQ